MNKIVVVLIVALVAAAGVTFVLLPGDEAPAPLPTEGDEIGLVYGNADGNFTIDDQDKRIIKAIMNGEKMFSDFPLADANCDGAVDQSDLDMVDKYLNKEDMKLNVLDDYGNKVPVKYPINNLFIMSGSAMINYLSIFDLNDRLTGVAVWHMDAIRDAKIISMIDNKEIIQATPWGSAADTDLISKTDTEVLVGESSRMFGLVSDDNVKKVNDLGIDVLRLDCKDPEKHIKSIAIMGIIYGQSDCAQEYQDYVDGVYEEIKKVEGDKFGSKTVMLKGTFGFAGQSNMYTAMIAAAGGVNAIDSEDSKGYHEGDQWIYEDQYKVDVLLCEAKASYGGAGFDDKTIASYNTFNKMDTWKNGAVFAYDYGLPPIIRVAYFAEAMYPDLFGAGWGDKIHQEFVDNFFDESVDYKVPADRFFTQIND